MSTIIILVERLGSASIKITGMENRTRDIPNITGWFSLSWYLLKYQEKKNNQADFYKLRRLNGADPRQFNPPGSSAYQLAD